MTASTRVQKPIFRVELPLAGDVIDVAHEGPAPGTASDHLFAQSTDGIKTKVPYIEDSPANLCLMGKIMARRGGIDLLTAHNARVAIDLARAHRRDAILLDINMPGMDGYEARGELRKLDATRNIPVLALSANALECDIATGMAAGFDDYLTKPFEITKLMQPLSNLTGHTHE